ncbi:MAG: FAD-dependent oxidoreductase [Thermomicrobiales bacterium]
MGSTEIVIIGGGVMGTSIAWQLAQKGAKVTLLERDQLAAQASGATAGGVRQLGRDARELPLAIASIARWQSLEEELEADVEFRRGGQLLVTEDPALILELERRGRGRAGARTFDPSRSQGDDFHAIANGFAPSIHAGITTENDGQASGKLTTCAFGSAAERAGATVRTGVTVTGTCPNRRASHRRRNERRHDRGRSRHPRRRRLEPATRSGYRRSSAPFDHGSPDDGDRTSRAHAGPNGRRAGSRALQLPGMHLTAASSSAEVGRATSISTPPPRPAA